MQANKGLLVGLLVIFGLFLSMGGVLADQNQSGNVSNSAPEAPSVFTPTSTQSSTPTLTWTRGTDANGDGVRTWWNVTLSDNTTLIESGTTAYGTQGTSDSTVLSTLTLGTYTVNMWSEDNSTNVTLNSSATIGTLNILPPNAPTTPVPSNNSNVHQSTVNVSWTNGTTTNPNAILRHDYQWCNTDATCASPSTIVNATAPQTQSGLVQDTTYHWRVRACDYDTNSCSAYTAASFTFTVNNTAPTQPSTFTPTTTHNATQTLSFTRGTDADADQVRTWYNATYGVLGASAIQVDGYGSSYGQVYTSGAWQTFNLPSDTALDYVLFKVAYLVAEPATVWASVYTESGTLLATSANTTFFGVGDKRLNFSGEVLPANATYGAYKIQFSSSPTSDSTIQTDYNSYADGRGSQSADSDLRLKIYGAPITNEVFLNTSSTSYGTQGTSDSVVLSSLVYGTTYAVNMWSEDDFSGGTKNSTLQTGTLSMLNTQPTAPSLNAVGTVWYEPSGNPITMTWTNGTDSDTNPTDVLTHYWQVASDSGYTTILDEGYKVGTATYSASSTATTNTTYYWRVLTNDNTGASNENSTWATGSFVILEHQPYYVGSSFTMTDDDLGTGGFQVNPVEAGSKTIFINATFFNAKGFADLANVTFTVTKSGSPFRTVSDVSLVQVDSTSARAHITFTMGYNETPQLYNVTVTSENVNGTPQAASHEDSFTFTSLTAYAVPTGDINYGIVTAGSNSSVQTMTLRNTGNVAFNPNISGSDLTGTATLPSSTVWYGTVSTQTIQLSNAPQSYASLVPVYTGTGGSSDLDLGWKWVVPLGTAAGTYTGTITIATA